MSEKTDTVSVLVRPSESFMERLRELAKRQKQKHKRVVSANQLLVEIAEMYTEMWAETEDAKEDMLNEQWEHTRKLLTQPLHPAKADGESMPKPQAQGKKGRK